MIIYSTRTGIKIPSVTREQMKEIDRIAMEETGPNLWQMMENAGRNLAQLTINLFGDDLDKKEILALAGKGNNGGGVICAARHLVNHGINIKLVLADENKLGEVPQYQKKIFDNAGGITLSIDDYHSVKPDIILDGIIGYNLNGAPRGILLEMIKWSNASSAKIISLDIPSGVDSNTGEAPGEYINAFATLTLALPKRGLFNDKTGILYLGDIGIPKETYNKIGIDYTSPFGKDYFVKLT